MYDDTTADTLVSLPSEPLSDADRERLEEGVRQLWRQIEAQEGEAALRRSLAPPRR